MTIDPRATMAARNNSDWYQMMGDVHGLRYSRDATRFTFVDQPPAYHSGMTITDPSQPATSVVARPPGTGVKDSFARLDLASFGLTPGISAQWIWRATAAAVDLSGWSQVTTADDLADWETAWKAGGSPMSGRQFPDAILNRDDVAIWGHRRGDRFVAGGITNRSADCTGLSNTFGPAALSAIAALSDDALPCVGYEWGDDLVAAQTAGFTAVGPLTIWFGAT